MHSFTRSPTSSVAPYASDSHTFRSITLAIISRRAWSAADSSRGERSPASLALAASSDGVEHGAERRGGEDGVDGSAGEGDIVTVTNKAVVRLSEVCGASAAIT